MKSAWVAMWCAISAVSIVGCNVRNNQARVPVPSTPIQVNTNEPGVIPAGATLVIRTNQVISTEQAGGTYTGEVAENVQDQSGRLLVPKGSVAELVVLQASGGGAVGSPSLALGVRSITVNGRQYAISTSATERSGDRGLGTNRRTAEMVGGGALLGTLIGAVAGGGRGAAAGALAGAAAGAAAQVFTRGKEIRVPAETLLTFRLEQPWRLTAF